ncbi:peptidoglycan DD-metalloendopeptidase family protein [Limibacterium fermenti]|uniref:peptidoglycan DD-metalloendopeptidase family protein n=1 Tax=Limibacterium fermenti TaxID=3229863 RepID=UPI003A7333AD
MERKKLLSKASALLLASFTFVTFSAFSQSADKKNADKSRPEVGYKQLHSSSLSSASALMVDGLKLKMDLSVLEEAEAEREAFNPNEIPADDIYQGMWTNRHVSAYGNLQNAPDSFMVDLSNFTMPCNGYMTSNFGRRGSRRYHYGIDLKAQTGDTIYAAFDGKVRVKQFERRGYGYYVVIRHINGLEIVYGHLSKFLVNENDFVRSGDPIALAGNTGRSFGSHLHFETRFLGKPINPNFIIDFQNKVCHRDEYLVTNSSYKKTSRSSKSIIRSDRDVAIHKAPSAKTNKYVSGNVKYHRIKRGDTLGAIAQRYGVSIRKLCSLNNLSRRTTLRVGKSIRIS